MRRHNNDKRKPLNKKPWNRDAIKGNDSSKKELAAFVRQQAQKELCNNIQLCLSARMLCWLIYNNRTPTKYM
jgi:hypothetical protein